MEDVHHQILIISNEPVPFVKSITDRLGPGQSAQAFRFKDGALIDVLRQNSFSSAFIDLSETDEFVLEVLGQLQKVCPSAPVFCLSASLPAAQSWLSRDGSFYFLPAQAAGLPLPPVDQRSSIEPQISFRGEFQAESLTEVVQLLLAARVSGRLVVWRRWSRGELWLHRGVVVHAELGERRGRAAVLSLLEWPRGTFRLHMGQTPRGLLQIGLGDPLFQLRLLSSGTPPEDAQVGLPAATERPSGPLPADEPSSLAACDRSGDGRGSVTLTLVREDAARMPAQPEAAPSGPLPRSLQEDSAQAASPLSERTPEPVPPSTPSSDQAEPESLGQSPEQSLEQSLEQSAGQSVEQSAEQSVEQSLEQSLEQAWLQIDATELFNETETKEQSTAVTSSTVKDALSKLEQSVEGFIGAAVADSDSGMCLGSIGGSGALNVEVAAAGNTEVVRAKRKLMETLNLHDEIEDFLISLDKQYHLIRPLRSRPSIFIYLAVDRTRTNLAMARFALVDAERDLGA